MTLDREGRIDTGAIVEPPAGFAGSVPSPDHAIELWNLCLQHPQVGTESGHSRTGQRLATVCHLHLRRQLVNRMASDWRDDPELRKVGADGNDHRGLLADEQVMGTVQRQAVLLLWRLARDKPHVGPGDRFADRLGINSIILVPLHIRLHVGRGH